MARDVFCVRLLRYERPLLRDEDALIEPLEDRESVEALDVAKLLAEDAWRRLWVDPSSLEPVCLRVTESWS